MRIPKVDTDPLKLLGIENKLKPISMPNFSGIDAIPTKSTPAMSEDRFKDAIIAQAKNDFGKGKFGGHNNSSYMVLKNSFVSVVSSDRKGSIAETIRKFSLLQRSKVSYLEIKDVMGNITSTYAPHQGWHAIGTKEEQWRESEFDAIYTETWRALKAEAQQQVKPISSSIDTFI